MRRAFGGFLRRHVRRGGFGVLVLVLILVLTLILLALVATAFAAGTALRRTRRLLRRLRFDRVGVHDDAATMTMLTGRGEGLDEARAEPLACHLHEAQRCHLGHLMPGAVAAERFGQAPQHQIPVGLEHHVDEVDDDHPADVAEPHLPDDLLGGLEVVAGDGFLEVSARPGELTRVDVHHRHRLGAIDDQCAPRGQPDLAVECLGELFVDAVRTEHVDGRLGPILFRPRQQVGRDGADVVLHRRPRLLPLDDELREVLVEQVSHDLDEQIGFFVQGLRLARGVRLLLVGVSPHGLPLGLQPGHVAGQFLLADTFGGGTDDDTRVGRDDLAEDVLETLAFGVGQLPADTGRRSARHIDEEASGEADLRGQPGSLVPDRVLADLHDHLVAGLESLLDLAGVATEPGGLPVHLTRVQHTVAAAADVDERRFHGGQDVLDTAEVDVADHRRRTGARDEVLDEDAVLEHRHLRHSGVCSGRTLPHDHDPFDGLAAGEELRFGEDRRAPASGLATVAATLALGLEAGRPADALHLVLRCPRLRPRLAFVDDGVRRIVLGHGVGTVARTATAATTATTARRAFLTGRLVGRPLCSGTGVLGVAGVASTRLRLGRSGRARRVRALRGLLTGVLLGGRVGRGLVVLGAVAASAPTSAATSPAPARMFLVLVGAPCGVARRVGRGGLGLGLLRCGSGTGALAGVRLGRGDVRLLGLLRSGVLGCGFRTTSTRPATTRPGLFLGLRCRGLQEQRCLHRGCDSRFGCGLGNVEQRGVASGRSEEPGGAADGCFHDRPVTGGGLAVVEDGGVRERLRLGRIDHRRFGRCGFLGSRFLRLRLGGGVRFRLRTERGVQFFRGLPRKRRVGAAQLGAEFRSLRDDFLARQSEEFREGMDSDLGGQTQGVRLGGIVVRRLVIGHVGLLCDPRARPPPCRGDVSGRAGALLVHPRRGAGPSGLASCGRPVPVFTARPSDAWLDRGSSAGASSM